MQNQFPLEPQQLQLLSQVGRKGTSESNSHRAAADRIVQNLFPFRENLLPLGYWLGTHFGTESEGGMLLNSV